MKIAYYPDTDSMYIDPQSHAIEHGMLVRRLFGGAPTIFWSTRAEGGMFFFIDTPFNGQPQFPVTDES